MEPQDNVQLDEFGNPIPQGMTAVTDYMTGQPVYVPQEMMPAAPANTGALFNQSAGIKAAPPAAIPPTASVNSASPAELDALKNNLKAAQKPKPLVGPSASLMPDEAPAEGQDSRIPAPKPGMTGGQGGVGGAQYGTTTTTDTRDSSMGADGRQAWSEAGQQVEQAAKAKMDAEVGLNNAKAAHDTAMGNSLMIDAQKREAANQAHFAEVQRRQMDVDRTVAELANTKIDASHFWADKSTGDKIAVGIAMMLGAMGQAKAAQAQNPDANAMAQNPVAIQMDRLIEQDIAQQKFAYENKKNTLQNQKGLISDLMAQYKDMNMAQDVARATYYEALKNQFEGIAVTSKNEIAKANAAAMVAEVAAKAADARGRASTHETIRKDVTAPLTKGLGPDSVKPLEKNVMDEMGAAKAGVDAAAKIKNIFSQVPDDQYGPFANILLETEKKFGLPIDARSQAAWESAMAGAMQRYKILSPGTLTKFDIDLALKLAPSLKNKESAMTTINAMEQEAGAAYQSLYDQYDSNWGGEGSRFRHVFKPYEKPLEKKPTGLKK